MPLSIAAIDVHPTRQWGTFFAMMAQQMKAGSEVEAGSFAAAARLLKEALVKTATVKGDTAFWDPTEAQLDGGRRADLGSPVATRYITLNEVDVDQPTWVLKNSMVRVRAVRALGSW